MSRGRRPWSAVEQAHLRRFFADTPTRQIADTLGRTPAQVWGEAGRLGLRKSPEYVASSCRIQRGARLGAQNQFKPGHQPWNRGTRYAAGGRSVETRFSKGNRPQTWKPVGSERLTKDGYLQRKISDTGDTPRDWRGVHILKWEEAHGPVPPGHALVFRDGNPLNAELANLELLTRAELMARNTIHRFPPELKTTIRLVGKLKRTIRNVAREKQDH